MAYINYVHRQLGGKQPNVNDTTYTCSELVNVEIGGSKYSKTCQRSLCMPLAENTHIVV